MQRSHIVRCGEKRMNRQRARNNAPGRRRDDIMTIRIRVELHQAIPAKSAKADNMTSLPPSPNLNLSSQNRKTRRPFFGFLLFFNSMNADIHAEFPATTDQYRKCARTSVYSTYLTFFAPAKRDTGISVTQMKFSATQAQNLMPRTAPRRGYRAPARVEKAALRHQYTHCLRPQVFIWVPATKCRARQEDAHVYC